MKKLLSVFFVCIFIFSLIFAKTHVVKKGDTLWDIAGYYLNNPFLWPEIYELNKDKIEDPHWIYPEQVFELPIPGEDNTSVTGASARNVPESDMNIKKTKGKFNKIKYADLEKIYRGKKLSIEWLKARKMIAKTDYVELSHFPNNVSFMGLYYGGFVTDKNIERGKISRILGDNSLENEAIKFDRVEINLGKEQVKKGEELTVFSYGKNITASSRKAGRAIKILGTVKVIEVFNTYSICVVKSSRIAITKGMLVTDLWTPPYMPDFDFVKANRNIDAGILGYRDNDNILKDYNIAYLDKGRKEGFTQGDKFDIVDAKGNAHGQLQLLWVGDDFSTGYIIRTGDINLKKYKKATLEFKSLPKGGMRVINKVPIPKVTEEQVVKEETSKVFEEAPKVIQEEPEKPETTTVMEEETAPKITVEEQPGIIEDTVRSDSNATIIMERPETTKTTTPIIEEEAPTDTTTPVIQEESPADTDTASIIIEEGG